MGVIDGMLDAPGFGAPKKKLSWLETCIVGMNGSQVAAIVDKALRDSPEHWNEPLNGGVFAAMAAACQSVSALSRVGRIAEIPPFTSADWAAEFAAYQADGYSRAVPIASDRRTTRRTSSSTPTVPNVAIAGCKSCGCWQETDGTPAYRCSCLIHSCMQPIPDGAMCKNCDKWGPRPTHRCHRVLPAAEIGVTKCRQCGIVQTVVHVVGWPVRAE